MYNSDLIEQFEVPGNAPTHVLLTTVPTIGYVNMSLIVYWYDENSAMQQKDFEYENNRVRSKDDFIKGVKNLSEQIGRWMKESKLSRTTVTECIKPYLDDLYDLASRIANLP